MPASLATAAREAYSAGWALSGGPLTGRVKAGCEVAAGLAAEHADDPGILESTLIFGQMTGTWALVYQRRDRLLAKHLKTAMAAWNAIVRDLDPRELVSAFRAGAYLSSESASPHAKFWRDTGTAAALAWLRQVYDDQGYADLVAVIEDAIRSGMAEGEAGALALAASKQGKTGFSIAKTFRAAYARLADDHTITATAAAALTKIIDGAGSDLGRRLASEAGDDGSEDDMAGAVDDVATGNDVRSVRSWLGDTIWGAIGVGAMALYALAGVEAISWITAGDGRVCPVCGENEDNSPYVSGDVPAYPAHPGCRCSLDTDSSLVSAFLN